MNGASRGSTGSPFTDRRDGALARGQRGIQTQNALHPFEHGVGEFLVKGEFRMVKEPPTVSFFSVVSFAISCSIFVGGISEARGQRVGQEVCLDPPRGGDVFSVGDVRASILSETPFQEVNGAEWVLMDGRPLYVRTRLSPHLLHKDGYGLVVPDARGRFLRMANNNACAGARANEDDSTTCLASHDTDGDRVLGSYQADAFGGHAHGTHSHVYGDVYAAENPTATGSSGVDIHEDGRGNDLGSGRSDRDNDGVDWDRTSRESTVPRSGGKETRPKNIAVNFYVKICDCRTRNCK